MIQVVNESSPLVLSVLQEFRQKHMPDKTRNITVDKIVRVTQTL